MISIQPSFGDDDQSIGLILSEKFDGQWKHSAAEMKCTGSPANKADDALPTYPTGNEQFLNGGDL